MDIVFVFSVLCFICKIDISDIDSSSIKTSKIDKHQQMFLLYPIII